MDENLVVYDKDVSFRIYILKARDYFSEILRYWYIPATCALLVAAYQVYKYSSFVPLYTAQITFSIDEDEGGGQAGLTGMLSQMGLGTLRPTRYNFDKILELSRSRRVVQEAMFAKITVDGKEDFLANHVIRIYEIDTQDEDGSKEGPFVFTHDSFPAFRLQENEMLKSVYHFIIGPPKNPELALLKADYNEDSNILSLTASTKNESLSIELARRMFQSLSNYYVNKAIEKAQKTYRIVSTKRDSVLGVLRSAEYQLANFKDRNRGLIMKTDQVTELRLQREVAAMASMYAEVLKNTEVADFSLRTKTPFIQVIDTPIPPLDPSQSSLIRKIILGLIIGGIIGVAIVAGRKAFRDLMAEDSGVYVT